MASSDLDQYCHYFHIDGGYSDVAIQPFSSFLHHGFDDYRGVQLNSVEIDPDIAGPGVWELHLVAQLTKQSH
jgi:hypothetical protein